MMYLMSEYKICFETDYLMDVKTNTDTEVDFWEHNAHKLLRHLSQVSGDDPPVVLILLDVDSMFSLFKALASGSSLLPVVWFVANPGVTDISDVPSSHSIFMFERKMEGDVTGNKVSKSECVDDLLLDNVKTVTHSVMKVLAKTYDKYCPENVGMCAKMLEEGVEAASILKELGTVDPSEQDRWTVDGHIQHSFYISVYRMVGGVRRNDKVSFTLK